MGKIKKILENELVGGTQNTDVYPVTSTKAVYDENNENLDSILKRRGTINVSTNYNADHTAEVLTLSQAIAKVPSSDRVLGFTMTFLSSDGWKNYQFTGTTIDNWTDINNWTSFVNDAQLKSNQDSITEKLNTKVNNSDIVQQTGDSTTSVMSQKAVSDELSELSKEIKKKLPKDSDSDSSISDGSEEFVVTDSKNKIAFKVDSEGTKASKYNICDEKGNVVKTITKELLDKIEKNNSENSKVGNTCLLQERKGTYYEILKYSVSGNLKASVDTNIAKFNRSIRVECDGVESTDDTTTASRGIFTMDFTENPIKVDETLSFWYFIPTKYWRPSQITGSTEKKSLDVIRICAYTGVEKIFEDNYAFGQYAYNVGWNLYKFLSDSFVGKYITKITFNFVSFNNNPNFQVWIGQFVADQRITPILNFNMDHDMRGISYTSGFANWLLENEFPVDLRINHLQETSNEDPGYTIVRKLYKKGLANAMPYSGSARTLNLKESVEYLLNNERDGRLTSLYSSNSERDVVAVGNATNHIDDTLLVAERLAGYKIMRSTNAYYYTSYIDKESCIMQTTGIGTIPSEEPDDVDSLINNRIEAAKVIIDKAIKYGLAINFFTHQVCSKNQKGENDYNSLGSYYEAVTEILSYAKEKEKQGKIRIMSMYNISKELQL